MTLRKQARSKRRGYGGQAVLEGVMIRGPRHATVVCRRPDGTIASQSKKLATAYTSHTQRIPFVRGVIALAETLHLGFWALIYSSNVALEEEEGDDGAQAEGAGITGALIILLTLAIAIGLFFLAPVFAGRWIEDQIDPDIIGVILEGVIRLALLLGYLFLIGQWSEMRRVFAYHGAEHKTIAAWEAMSDLSVAAVRPFSRAHPRCGTSFLLVVAVVAIIVFTALGTPPMWWRITSRIVLVPVIAGIAYEAIRLGGAYRHKRVIGWLFAPNLWLQALTTREPSDDQITVAITAMEQALAAEEGRSAQDLTPAR
ncbi:MAG: DUF1385 domain-containing protein [Chloroflexi bacterium]|nr:DUF1385 domain-containing protein [Chloroflexota bacterium]